MLPICAYLFAPSISTRDLAYDVMGIVLGLSVIATVLIGVRVYRPARSLPWYLFTIGLVLLVAGEISSAFYEDYLKEQVRFPSPIDALYLSFYPFMAVGLSLLGRSRSNRRSTGSLIDPLVIAIGFGLLFWVYFMEPYLVKAFAGNPSVTPVSILTAVAYPSMDLLLLAVLMRTLLVNKKRPPAYRLLGAGLGLLLVSDIVWTVAQAMLSSRLIGLVDIGFLLFLALFGAAASHPSMAVLFEPVPPVEAKLTRPRLALLAGASLMAPAVLALQALRGESINAPLFVAGSAALFSLVVARMAGMMRARERAADRERVLRRAGATLTSSQNKEELCKVTLEAALALLQPSSVEGVSLWEGPAEKMTATTDEETSGRFSIQNLPEEIRECFSKERSFRMASSKLDFARETVGYAPKAYEVLVVPLRARRETTGAMVVVGRTPFSQESRNALEALGAEVALALENLQLLEEVRRTSVLKERQRLSHEIHDTLAQGFTSIVMSLSAAQLAHPEVFSDSAPSRRHLELAQRTARESLAETRRLVWALRPEALDRHPLPQALGELVEGWSEKTAIESRFNITGDPRQLLPETEVVLLRIAQEALSNVYKHAGADHVVLTLSYLDNTVALDVSDDGIGFEQNNRKPGVRPQDVGGFGLVAMQERVEQLNGTFSVESTRGGGATLAAELPAYRASSEEAQPVPRREVVEEAL